MLKRFRSLVSANLVAVLFISTLILSKSEPIKACPAPPPPKTLLALYLQSDLIFVAEITSEKDGEIITDEEDYLYIEVLRNLNISSVLKGKPPRNFGFTKSEYRNKKPVEETADEEEYEYSPYGYKGYSELKVGERYLFFFTKNKETNQYDLTDEVSGYKKLSDADLYIHKKRIEELKPIVKAKENQLNALTEWLIRCIEEPSTRWDGAFDLNTSFAVLESAEAFVDEDPGEKKPFIIGRDGYENKQEIARNLSDYQKEYISSIAFSLIQLEMSDSRFSNFYYSLSNLVRRWDKSRLGMYAYSFLQTVNKSDAEKTKEIMEYVSNVLDDNELFDIASVYPTDNSSEETEEIIEEENDVTSGSENETEEVVKIVQQTELNTNIQVEESKESEPQTRELSLAQKQEKILRKFINRYENLLARGFPGEKIEDENELAEK